MFSWNQVASIERENTSWTLDGLTAEQQWKSLTSADTVNTNQFTVHLKYAVTGEPAGLLESLNTVIMAVGRHPKTASLGLENTDIKLAKNGFIQIDEYQSTTAAGVYAVGDVCGPVLLTPVAIAAGRRLVDRLFGGETKTHFKVDYENIPSVVFSHPPCGTVGLTEPNARKKYGDDQVKIYQTRFFNLFYAMSDQDRKVPTIYKVSFEYGFVLHRHDLKLLQWFLAGLHWPGRKGCWCSSVWWRQR